MSIKDPVLLSACAYIKEHLHRKITMLDLRTHTSYSERSLQLKFKRYLNQTPFEYMEEQRLLKARELIIQYKQTKKITDVAYEAGLRHLGRFSVKFKKRFGVSASDLAKS